MPGKFITFEGVEGAGKTTVIAGVADLLRARGCRVRRTREPGGTPLGDAIRALLLDPAHGRMAPIAELCLYAAARAQHVAEVIRPALDAGEWVLCDRYADATTAYQGAARKIPAAIIRHVRRIATDGVEPDVTILLDLPVEIGRERLARRGAPIDRLEGESMQFHERVRKGYLRLARKEPGRIKVVDARNDIETVCSKVMEYLDRTINNQSPNSKHQRIPNHQ